MFGFGKLSAESSGAAIVNAIKSGSVSSDDLVQDSLTAFAKARNVAGTWY